MNWHQLGSDFMELVGCLIPLGAFFWLVWRHMHGLATRDTQQRASERVTTQLPAPTKTTTTPIQRLQAKQWLHMVNNVVDVYPHLFLVGKTRSGKTLTCQAIIAHRSGQVVIIDPKDTPGKWGQVRAIALDDDLSYTGIETACHSLLDVLKHRQRGLNKGLTDFETLTVVIDEFPVVVSECPTAAVLYKKIGQIGAELRVRLVALSQSDRVKTLGLSGEGDSRDNFLYLAFGNKAREVAKDIPLPTYPCIAKTDEGLIIFDTREVPKLAQQGIAKDRLWVVPYSTAISALEHTETPLVNVAGSTVVAPEKDEKGTTGSICEDWQRQAILSLARQKISRRQVCERVFGTQGGKSYEVVKAILDEARL